MKCEMGDDTCRPPSYRGSAGWLCDHHWEHLQNTVKKVKDARKRKPKDTEL